MEALSLLVSTRPSEKGKELHVSQPNMVNLHSCCDLKQGKDFFV